MREKMQGLVLNQSEMLITDVKLAGYGITKDSRLVDVINIVNGAESNNVLRLAIVDENGADVTASSKEAQSLCVGVMFPGVYTIGRDKAAEGVTVKTQIDYVLASKAKPHTNYREAIWKELNVNSDVNTEFPLFAKAMNDLSALLPTSADINGEWLKAVGMIDKIAIKNKVDYEEVELDEFDLYQRLGSGYAQTAQIIALKGASDDNIRGYKVTIPDSNNVNRVIGIEDGIYSMLENHSTNYTVLASANAETKISGKLPRKDVFKKREAGTFKLSENDVEVIEIATKINEKDFSDSKAVKIVIKSVEDEKAIDQATILKNLDTSIKARRIIGIKTDGETAAAKHPEGTLVAVDGTSLKKVVKGALVTESVSGYFLADADGGLKLYKCAEGTLTEHTAKEGNAIIATNGQYANVYKEDASAIYEPISTLAEIANTELDEDYTLCHVEDLATGLTVNVFSTEAQWMTFSELVDKLNENEVFAKLFKASALKPDTEVGSLVQGTGQDKGKIYFDTTMYVPYTTTDNFARHLAQHCVYTSLKTFPTHGIIGCAKLNGVNLSTIADRVNEILALDLDLYAKRPNGNNMLNNNNMPHPIGRAISIPFVQYTVTTGNGYNYVSNGAAGYAGMVSTLDADKSSTNQPISLPTLAFELSNYQLSKLTGKGIVTVKTTTQGTVVTDGITMAPVDSAYRRLSTTKVINVVDAALREVIEPYIGSQDNLATRNSLQTAITSRLNKLKEKLISYYKFNIVSDSSAARLGIIKVQYVVIPYNEIKEVRNTLSVQESN